MLHTELSPSVSRIIRSVVEFSEIGLFHIQIPFVQGFVVGPISNPFILRLI